MPSASGPGPEFPFEKLVEALSDPRAFPGSPARVECLHTHISAVFLVGNLVYKVKKPKNLGFLDFTSLSKRRYFCHEEVRLNRRLAPRVYEGVVPVLWKEGAVRVSETAMASLREVPHGEVLEWAVRMVRLPEARSLGALLARGRVGEREVGGLATRLARFHATADRGGRISEGASWDTISGNDRENFEQIAGFVGHTISAPVYGKLRELTATELASRREAIEQRALGGVAREVHGDLRLEHIYLLPPGTPGRSERGRRAEGHADDHSEFVIIDCIEFNERFRWADPVADLAFLVMEMELVGRSDLAGELARRYFLATGDPEGAGLLPYYVAYRGIVRGKVRSLQAADELMAPGARDGAAAKAGRHFLHALGRLSRPADRPALVVVQGLPGVGKSTVAEALSKALGFAWIDTDRVRGELAAPDPAMTDRETEAGYGTGLYSEEWNDRTYRECERRAREELWRGGRVVVAGSFRRERHRVAFLEAGRSLGVPVVFLSSSVEPAEARRRLAGRRAGPSEADWRIHARMSQEWEAPSELTAPCTRRLSLDGGREDAVRRATEILCDMGLA